MNKTNLRSERRNLQQVKTSILYKAEIAEKKLEKGGETIENVRFYYSRVAAIEVQIVKLLLYEGKEKKIYPNLISAISCYIKAEDYDSSTKLLNEHYPEGSKHSTVEVVQELRRKVADIQIRMKAKRDLKKPVFLLLSGHLIGPLDIARELYHILNKLINNNNDFLEIEISGFIDFPLIGEDVNKGIRLLTKYKELLKS